MDNRSNLKSVEHVTSMNIVTIYLASEFTDAKHELN